MSSKKPIFSPYFAFGICVLYFVLLNIVQLITLSVVGLFFYDTDDLPQLIQLSSQNGFVVAYSIFFTALFFIIISPLIIYFYTKNHHITKQFFAIRLFSIRQLFYGLFLLTIMLLISEILTSLLNKNHLSFLDNLINTNNQFWLTTAIVIISPIYEEVLFRGMMYGTIAYIAPNQGTTLKTFSHHQWAGLFISSILFTYVHLQYDWFGMMIIFCLALLFGYVRIKYGLLLAILLHITNNAIAMINYLYF
ncbi:CPBP family intramembrane glutamic endopeptidase [Moraxella oblonga]|uniref:CPBP family intramembrane glutamic endopeptidase n=1 Tax=Moraxella oblonga TaxID=200413 RepID=UPI0008320C27|nr:CPBP family intramembrane glutamic endopeptidase [Moraxella oblonga]